MMRVNNNHDTVERFNFIFQLHPWLSLQFKMLFPISSLFTTGKNKIIVKNCDWHFTFNFSSANKKFLLFISKKILEFFQERKAFVHIQTWKCCSIFIFVFYVMSLSDKNIILEITVQLNKVKCEQHEKFF